MGGNLPWYPIYRRARWRPGEHEIPDEKITYIVNLKEDVGNQLNKALAALEDANPELTGVLQHIDFNAPKGKTRLSDRQLVDLIHHFDKFRLTNEDFEFPDLLGAAYEFLIKDFADNAAIGRLYYLAEVRGIKIYSGWAPGSTKYLHM